MTRSVVDTNIFLRLLLNDVPQQVNKVEQLFKKARNNKGQLIVPQIVIFELTFALEKYYKLPKAEIVEKLDAVLAMDYLEIQDRTILQEALSTFKNKSLSLVDCFIFCFAKKENAQIFTFDKNLQKLQSN